MGRFVKKKGFDVFINAIANLNESGIRLKAVIGGSGEEEGNLKKLVKELNISDIVEFTGWIKNKEQFFDNIDFFVLPSLHEPFGIILLEAFAHGKAVVTSDAEGPGEIASNNVDAVIVRKGDAALMANGIKSLIENRDLAQKIAKNGFEKAQEYDIKNFAYKLSAIISNIVKN